MVLLILLLLLGTSAHSPLFQPWDLSSNQPTLIDPLIGLQNSRPPPNQRKFVSKAIDDLILNISRQMKDKDLALLFENCLPNTLDTTVDFTDLGGGQYDTFVVTGDILAMWFRDSTNQVLPYVPYTAQDTHLKNMIKGLINRQVKNVLIDPYANAFNKVDESSPWLTDATYKPGFLGSWIPGMNLMLHERKYELDSLAAVMKLSYAYFQANPKDTAIFDNRWRQAMESILAVIQENQDPKKFTYNFARETTRPTDTLLWGVGPPANITGMSKSFFRPSDDACSYPFPIASNAMAVVELRHLSQIALAINWKAGSDQALKLAAEIDAGIQKWGPMTHPILKTHVYAYEVDGLGNAHFMDDANIPSLLSLPYLGYESVSSALYNSTRAFLLSPYNPFFFSGSAASGIGGPHVGNGMIWPMSIMTQILTSTSDSEIMQCLAELKISSAGTGFMHESFSQNNAASFTRAWFAWANSLFGETILYLAKEKPHLIF